MTMHRMHCPKAERLGCMQCLKLHGLSKSIRTLRENAHSEFVRERQIVKSLEVFQVILGEINQVCAIQRIRFLSAAIHPIIELSSLVCFAPRTT